MNANRLLTTRDVCESTSLSRSTIWRLTREGRFPKPIQISNTRKAYVAEEVDDWVKNQINERDGVTQH